MQLYYLFIDKYFIIGQGTAFITYLWMNSSIKRFEVLTGNATDFMKKYEYKASRAETFGEGWGHKISCLLKVQVTRTRTWRVFIFSYSRLVLIYLYMQLMWLFLGRIAPTNFDLPHSTTIYTFISFLYTLVLSSEFLLFLPTILFI